MMRSATSMIELVISIVVMGIVVMSLPLILTQVEKNNAFAMQQEAILAAKTKIGDVLTYDWDENGYSATAGRTYVLDTTNGDPELQRIGTTNRRVGHVNAESRRKFFDVNTTATAVATLGSDGANDPIGIDDVDDWSGVTTAIAATAENAGTLDYIFDLNMTTTVTYATDTATYSNTPLNNFTFNPDDAVAITNIKTISVTVRGADNNITLRAFTSNIGESTPLPSRPYR